MKYNTWNPNYSLDPNPYFCLEQVKDIYFRISGKTPSSKFIEEAKSIAKKTKGGTYIFDDENALFALYQKYIGYIFNLKGIENFGKLMQRV